jgi:nitrile hydratase subunit beta
MTMLTKEMVPGLLVTGASERLDDPAIARFSVGQRVKARNLNPEGHTRVTQYAKGKIGTVEIDLGVFILPDTMAHGNGPCPQHVYSVSFTAQELWGAVANVNSTVRLDLWDDHLELVSEKDASA